MKILSGENKRRIKIIKVYVRKDIQAQEKTSMKKLYYIKFYKFNVVKMENSKRNRRNLRFKLAFERFILIIMIIKNSIAFITRRNDYYLFHGDITYLFGGLQTGFQVGILACTIFCLMASYFFNQNPIHLNIINLIKVYNKEVDPKVINLFHQKQIKKFQQFCKISQLIYDQSMYMYQPIFSIFYVVFTFIKFSSFELIIMLFWSLIYISWLLIITDCLTRCTEWSILTFLYMLLLIDQFKDDLNSKIYQSKDKCSDFGVRIVIKRLNQVSLIFKSLYHF